MNLGGFPVGDFGNFTLFTGTLFTGTLFTGTL